MKQFKKILFILPFTVLIFSYQNCGKKNLNFEDLDLTSMYKLFNYRYTSAPKAYFEVKQVQMPSDTGFKKTKFIGYVSPVDPSIPSVAYSIDARNDANERVCPLLEGSTTNLNSLLEGECVFEDTTTIKSLTMEITINEEKFSYVQKFD